MLKIIVKIKTCFKSYISVGVNLLTQKNYKQFPYFEHFRTVPVFNVLCKSGLNAGSNLTVINIKYIRMQDSSMKSAGLEMSIKELLNTTK